VKHGYFRGDVERQGCFTGRLRTVHLHDASARESADAEREVKRETLRRDCLDRHLLRFAEAHNRAVAELVLDLCNRIPRSREARIRRGLGHRLTEN
jgi:hypothetical protein